MFINTPLQDLRVPRALASFNGSSAYRLEGDRALLSADVCLDAEATPAGEWALQLWACAAESAPGCSMIAQLPIMSFEFPAISVEGWANLLPPLSHGAHAMTLVLASGRAGVFDQIHDMVEFEHSEVFVQPRFVGDLSVSQDAAQLLLTTPAVINPRGADNLSGTLSVELWALGAPYVGGAFTGVPLDSALVGVLAGQTTAEPRSLQVPQDRIAADAVVVVMLREWTALGYLTRDVWHLDRLPATPLSGPEVTVAVAAPKAASAVAAKGKRAAATSVEDERISINAASEAELAALKGLSRAAASGIVAARPYASMDELVRAKGIGEKLLARLRSFLRL